MEIFKKKAKIEVDHSPEREIADGSSSDMSKLIVKRRQSLPAYSFITRQMENRQMARQMGKGRRKTISSPIKLKDEPCKLS